MSTSKEGRDEKGRFIAGNTFSLGLENNGRNPFYSSPIDLANGIEDYFETCWNKTRTQCKPTIAGLAYHLGFKSRQSLYDYINSGDDLSYVVERARLKIEEMFELRLYEYAWGGPAFWLKNHDWKDEVTQNQNQQITTVQPQVVSGTPPLESNDK